MVLPLISEFNRVWIIHGRRQAGRNTSQCRIFLGVPGRHGGTARVRQGVHRVSGARVRACLGQPNPKDVRSQRRIRIPRRASRRLGQPIAEIDTGLE